MMRYAGIALFWALMAAALYFSRRKKSAAFWPLLALALLLLFNLFFTPQFFRLDWREGHLYGVPVDILNHASKVGILALGMTLVIAVGGIDLSVGAVMAISGAVMTVLSAQFEAPPAVCVAAGVALGFVAGMWNGFLVAVMRIPPIVATLILMVAGRGIAQLITDGQIVVFHDATLSFIGNGFVFLPFSFILTLILLAAFVLGTRGTAAGFLIAAVGDNETAVSRAGVNARSVKFLVYTLCGLTAAIAGLVATANIHSADANNIGLNLELDAIMSVVIGGTAMTGGRFNLGSSVIGAILIQTLTTTMYAMDVPPVIAPVPKAVVILGVCLLQSDKARNLLSGLTARSEKALR